MITRLAITFDTPVAGDSYKTLTRKLFDTGFVCVKTNYAPGEFLVEFIPTLDNIRFEDVPNLELNAETAIMLVNLLKDLEDE